MTDQHKRSQDLNQLAKSDNRSCDGAATEHPSMPEIRLARN